MLSQSTIKAQQRILDDWLIITCTILQPILLDDGYGVKRQTYVAHASNVPVRAQTATRVPKSGMDVKQSSVLTEWRIVLPVGTYIHVGWRILIAGRTFEVEDVDNLNIDMASVVCFCFDIER